MLAEIKNINLLISSVDWNRIRFINNHINEMISNNQLNNWKKNEPAYHSNIYSLGNQGGIIENFNLTDGSPWRTWTGLLLESLIPWSSRIRERFVSGGLNFVNFAYSKHSSLISSHIDGKTNSEATDRHCNLNFVISSDDAKSYTWVEDRSGHRMTYLSIKNTAWLLATDVAHGVCNTGNREVFQLKFHSPWEQVKYFLDSNPTLLDK